MKHLPNKIMPPAQIQQMPVNQYADNMISGAFDGAKKVFSTIGPYIPTIFGGILAAHIARALWKNYTQKSKRVIEPTVLPKKLTKKEDFYE